MPRENLAIVVGGGPAPGINGVVAAATIEAIKNGLRVVGVYDGYRHLAAGDASQTRELTLADAAHMRASGGSYLRTSRTNRRSASKRPGLSERRSSRISWKTPAPRRAGISRSR